MTERIRITVLLRDGEDTIFESRIVTESKVIGIADPAKHNLPTAIRLDSASVRAEQLPRNSGWPSTGMPFVLDRSLLTPATKRRWQSTTFISVDHFALTDLFAETATDLLNQLLRGLGYGVQPDRLNESVRAGNAISRQLNRVRRNGRIVEIRADNYAEAASGY